MWLLQVLLALVPWLVAGQVARCDFNSLCDCHDDGASCVDVLFQHVPVVPVGVSHLAVVGASVPALATSPGEGGRLESLRLVASGLRHVAPGAFQSSAGSLRSLELSANLLSEVPVRAITELASLEVLNLHGNQIAGLSGNWSAWAVRALFLGGNSLDALPSPPRLQLPRRLAALDLDGNQLSALNPAALPAGLTSLSAAANLLTEFPAELLPRLSRLAELSLRGNLISALPHPVASPEKRRTLDRLDLGDNLLQSLPAGALSSVGPVRDLHLDLNLLERLPAQAFRGVGCTRLFLAGNRLSAAELDEQAFVGLGHELEYLDLDDNRLKDLPAALRHLKRLKQLHLARNGIHRLENDSLLASAASLRALSLAGNNLSHFPVEALRPLRRLSHLDVGHNPLGELREEHFEGWATGLDTLLLPSTGVQRLPPHAFRHAPRLRELSLSSNPLLLSAPDPPDPLALAGLGGLQSLQLSSCAEDEDEFQHRAVHFPERLLRPLTGLVWLSVDKNRIQSMNSTALYAHDQLQYLNLEANLLRRLPTGLFHPRIHAGLREARLGRNRLETLDADAFAGLGALATAALEDNLVRDVAGRAFADLPSLQSVLLGNNAIASLEPRAFVNVPNLQHVDLHANRLEYFSLGAFFNATSPRVPMCLNLSSNRLGALFDGDTGRALHVHTLDAMHNALVELPQIALHRVAASLSRLLLAYNLVQRVDAGALPLPRLQVVSLAHNRIAWLEPSAFSACPGLQELNLAHNRIGHLHPGQFAGLTALRRVDLSHNGIRALPRGLFAGTSVESLSLAENALANVPPLEPLEPGHSRLRELDLSGNRIEHLDAFVFPPSLASLDLSRNRLGALPDGAFAGTGGLPQLDLLCLDLSGNDIGVNDVGVSDVGRQLGSLLRTVPNLRLLSLAGTGLRAPPDLPLSRLLQLNLSRNALSGSLPSALAVLAGLQDLRELDLAHNQLAGLRLPQLPTLRWLDISSNPIKALTRSSFSSLARLQELKVQDLPLLERFDADSLRPLGQLSHLSTQTWPSIEKYRFRLAALLSSLGALRQLSVRVLEPKLTDQLLGAFGPKLRRLHVSGDTLQQVAADALEGAAERHELEVQIRGTALTDLPPGLLARLSTVARLSLDLRDNRLSALPPSLPQAAARAVELRLSGNPWKCHCELRWLARWLRDRGSTDRDTETQCRDAAGLQWPLVDVDVDVDADAGPLVCRGRSWASPSTSSSSLANVLVAGLLVVVTGHL